MLPNILITNDDGITSAGLYALAQVLQQVGKVTVIAPNKNWSASGHQKTLGRFLRVDPYELPDLDIQAFASSGAPADCVSLAYLGMLEHKPDLVVSGINKGPNLGQDITYSGTVGAAFEAAIFGLPAIAVSLSSYHPKFLFRDAAKVTARIAHCVLKEGLPQHSLLNVNVPVVPAKEWRGVAITRLGMRDYKDEMIRGVDPSGRAYYWIRGVEPSGDIETPNTDIWAVHHGYVSITPIQLDMTNKRLIEKVRKWNFMSLDQ